MMVYRKKEMNLIQLYNSYKKKTGIFDSNILLRCDINPFKVTNLDSSKLKEFADNNFRIWWKWQTVLLKG